jgi:branched-chain amino acid transport system ATP-binding protein
MPVLEAVNVSAGYHGHAVVRDLNLTVEEGEVVALLGANGAGKTTTMSTLAGLYQTLSGDVIFDGKVTREPLYVRARRGLGYVTEERSIFKRLTTEENLRVGRCDQAFALELFPSLTPLLGRLGGQLSGGEQQILSVARALARHPRLFLADELSLGLAPIVVERLLDGIRAASQRGTAVMFVEQHVHQALRYADKVYVMRRGLIETSGTPSEVGPTLERSYLVGTDADQDEGFSNG